MMWKWNEIMCSSIECLIKTQYLLTKSVSLQDLSSTLKIWKKNLCIKILKKFSSESLSLSLCDSCVHVLCIRWQLFVFFFYSFSQSRLWEMIFMKFFQFFRDIFLNHCVWFPCSLFIFFSFDQEFELCGLRVSFHVINQVNKIRVFFVFDDCRLWWWHLPADWVVLWWL